jgi:hypothetical protein
MHAGSDPNQGRSHQAGCSDHRMIRILPVRLVRRTVIWLEEPITDIVHNHRS